MGTTAISMPRRPKTTPLAQCPLGGWQYYWVKAQCEGPRCWLSHLAGDHKGWRRLVRLPAGVRTSGWDGVGQHLDVVSQRGDLARIGEQEGGRGGRGVGLSFASLLQSTALKRQVWACSDTAWSSRLLLRHILNTKQMYASCSAAATPAPPCASPAAAARAPSCVPPLRAPAAAGTAPLPAP